MLSDWIKVRITSEPGSTFLDRMIALVEGAERQKTPNEIALNILLAGLTIIFLLATATIPSFAIYAGGADVGHRAGRAARDADPDHHRRRCSRPSASPAWTGWSATTCWPCRAGRSRRPATWTRCLLDKTGTITLGNRQATEFMPVRGVTEQELADAAQLASLADETPEGRSIVVLAKEKYGLRGRDMAELQAHVRAVHRADPDERRRTWPTCRSARARSMRS